ncbi:MAG: LamB/YcsF family protein [Chloroflexi bacterium]|nr:LamB/YcsF family protein [Chloroflexota bacterium]
MRTIDLNSDLGEGAGTDEVLIPLITSANVACGAHAGDERTMRETVALALKHGVAVGAHPGYRDPKNFGRLALDIPDEALREDLRLQIETLRRIAGEVGARVTHVKAHGALYNQADRDERLARAIAETVASIDRSLVLFAMPRSAMEKVGKELGLRVAREGFADRAYEKDGALRSRTLPGALNEDPAVASAQALSIARDGRVGTFGGGSLALEVETICLHGDTPGAPEIAVAVREALAAAGVTLRPLRV